MGVSSKMFKCVFVTFLVSSIRISNTISTKPNIVVILADDLGWNEVSWNNPKIQTPNLKELSDNGVLLTKSYVTPKCSPSRASLLTGIYPWRLGMQRGAVERWQPTGLNSSIPILPQFLKTA